jgi:tRNA modification GTPase
VRSACARARDGIDALLATADAGELAREGALVVIAGAPNAGKSSLFNALLGRQRALVTPVPGTTRDAIEATMDVGAWPVRLVDTAGLRETSDVVERLGIEVSERYLAAAELVLACGETDDDVRYAVDVVRATASAPVLAVRTKADLVSAVSVPVARGAPPEHHDTTGRAREHHRSIAPIIVSAERGDGMGALVAAIEAALAARHGTLAVETPLVTRARHRRALAEARVELDAFGRAWDEDELPAPVAAVHLRSAVHALESLVGAVDVEDVLGRLFSTFCVGK